MLLVCKYLNQILYLNQYIFFILPLKILSYVFYLVHFQSLETLIHDVLLLLENTINKYDLVEPLNNSFELSASCKNDTTWSFGNKLLAYLKMNKLILKSGLIDFDMKTGLRKNLEFYIIDGLNQSKDLVRLIDNNL